MKCFLHNTYLRVTREFGAVEVHSPDAVIAETVAHPQPKPFAVCPFAICAGLSLCITLAVAVVAVECVAVEVDAKLNTILWTASIEEG